MRRCWWRNESPRTTSRVTARITDSGRPFCSTRIRSSTLTARVRSRNKKCTQPQAPHLAQLHGDPDLAGCGAMERPVDGDALWTLRATQHGGNLALHALHIHFVHGQVDDLHRRGLCGRCVERAVHAAERALPKAFHELETLLRQGGDERRCRALHVHGPARATRQRARSNGDRESHKKRQRLRPSWVTNTRARGADQQAQVRAPLLLRASGALFWL